MASPPALTRQLSRALVAFTIEADNEFEHRMRHATTTGGGQGPWLTSLVMWATCLRHLPVEGTTVGDLRRRARTRTNLDGMRRWGYLTIEPAGRAAAPAPKAGAGSGRGRDRVGSTSWVRPTAAGLEAQALWAVVPGEIEQRWHQRFGPAVVGGLIRTLAEVDQHLPQTGPDCLPILGHGLWTRADRPRPPTDPGRPPPTEPEPTEATEPIEPAGSIERVGGEVRRPLWALLSRTLVALAHAFEDRSSLSLALTADILWPLGSEPMRVRDLPARAGVSRPAVDMALGVLARRELAVTSAAGDGSRWRTVALTRRGSASRRNNLARWATTEAELAAAGWR